VFEDTASQSLRSLKKNCFGGVDTLAQRLRVTFGQCSVNLTLPWVCCFGGS
jgi:hypothetical protein